MEHIKEMARRDLEEKYIQLLATCARQRNSIYLHQAQIRNFRIRLQKIRNSIDYLLSHPYSRDAGIQTWQDKRDTRQQRIR